MEIPTSTLLIRASSVGNCKEIKKLLEDGSVDIDAVDSDQSTALVHASCFGHEPVVKLLLEHNANVNKADSIKFTVTIDGWIPLFWAISNGHASIVRLLIEAGSDQTLTSKTGKTIQEIAKATGHLKLLSDETKETFDFTKGELDEMIVFNDESVEKIVRFAISKASMFSNVLFLCCRYANYYSDTDLLNGILQMSIESIMNAIHQQPEDIRIIAVWISNCTLLLHYMKKDSGLLLSAFQAQQLVSEFIGELTIMFYKTVQARLLNSIDRSILDYCNSPEPDYETAIRSLSRQMTLKNASNQLFGLVQSKSNTAGKQLLSPKSITGILTSVQLVLDSNDVHPFLIDQIMQQLYYFMAACIFNGILSSRDRSCRFKGVEIRMNILAIEEWINESYPLNAQKCLSYLKSPIQLCQLIQVLSSISDLTEFTETIESLPNINMTHAKRLVENYKYETGEASISNQILEHIDRFIQRMTLKSQVDLDYVKDSKMDLDFIVPFQMPQLGSAVDSKWNSACKIPQVPSEYIDILYSFQ